MALTRISGGNKIFVIRALLVGFKAEIAVEYFRKEEPSKKSISEC